eukprot:TRINITY_DN5367_c0_g1_i10.p3 TRINITY_DN5367_c0_g1~~TRINITY_DN5367_c0_g1_i10.p3  ORF type:complete len:100 (-),score=15.89 TRINITY_DN5367_c0_g1_i10:92-391(-)
MAVRIIGGKVRRPSPRKVDRLPRPATIAPPPQPPPNQKQPHTIRVSVQSNSIKHRHPNNEPAMVAARFSGDGARGGGSTPSGCCSRKGCGRPRAACRQR